MSVYTKEGNPRCQSMCGACYDEQCVSVHPHIGTLHRSGALVWDANGDIVRSLSQPDVVNHPSHYKSGGLESIDVIEAFELNFHLGNAAKYIHRAGRKGDAVEDLKKARWYIDREIARREKL